MSTKKLVVADNMVVGIAYTLRLDNGEIADSSSDGEPLLYLQGHGNVIPGLEQALYGLAVGDEKRVTVEPEEGYGEFDDENMHLMPYEAFPDDMEIEEGMDLTVQNEEGELFEAYVYELTDAGVVLDFNHPLAGETLYFDVKVVSLRAATEEELAHGHVHGADGHDH